MLGPVPLRTALRNAESLNHVDCSVRRACERSDQLRALTIKPTYDLIRPSLVPVQILYREVLRVVVVGRLGGKTQAV